MRDKIPLLVLIVTFLSILGCHTPTSKITLEQLIKMPNPQILTRFVGVGIGCGENYEEAFKNANNNAKADLAESIQESIYSYLDVETTLRSNGLNELNSTFLSKTICNDLYTSSRVKVKDLKQEDEINSVKHENKFFVRVVVSGLPLDENELKTQMNKRLENYCHEIKVKLKGIPQQYDLGLSELYTLINKHNNQELLTIKILNADETSRIPLKSGFDSVFELYTKNYTWVSFIWIDDDGIADLWAHATRKCMYSGINKMKFSAKKAKGKVTLIAIASANMINPSLLELPFAFIRKEDGTKLQYFLLYLTEMFDSGDFICAIDSYNPK